MSEGIDRLAERIRDRYLLLSRLLIHFLLDDDD